MTARRDDPLAHPNIEGHGGIAFDRTGSTTGSSADVEPPCPEATATMRETAPDPATLTRGATTSPSGIAKPEASAISSTARGMLVATMTGIPAARR